MSPKRQKGKGGKRLRGWHHGPLEDRRFDEAITRLAGAGLPPHACPHCDSDPCRCAEIVTREADDAFGVNE